MAVSEEEVSDFLVHFGVKGMKWGVRRNPAKRLEKKDANSAMVGWGIRGWAAQKVNKKYIKKNKLQKFETKDYEKLPKSEQKKYDAKVKRRAYRATTGRTAVQALLVAGAGSLAVKKLDLDPKTKDLVKEGSIGAAGIITVLGAMQTKGIHDSYAIDKLRKEVHGN